MKTKVLAILLLAGSSLFARSHVFFGVGVGGGYYGPGYGVVVAPPPPPPVYSYVAPRPAYAVGYSYIPGYYYPVGPRYYWHAGYWGRPPYVGARWYAPRYYGGRYYRGHWR